MTQNNDYRGKARAVFLAALMVFSVLAVPVAFTGSAAAAENVSVDKVTHYEDTNDDRTTLEITLANDVNVTNSSVSDPTEIIIRDSDDNNLKTLDASDLVAGTNGTSQLKFDTGSVYYRADHIVVNHLSKAGGTAGEAVDGEEFDVTVSAPTFDLNSVGSKATVYQGATVAVINNSAPFDSLEIEEADGSYYVERGSGENSSVYRFDTSDRNLGTYNLTDQNESTTQQIELRDLGLELSPDSFEIAESENFEGTISARPSNRDIDVDVLDSAGDSVASAELNTGGDGEVDYDLASQEAGEYTVEITDVQTGETLESDTISVTDQGGLTAEFAEGNVDVTQGDIAEITVNFNNGASEGDVIIGNIDESGYQYNVSISDTGDDNQATLYFNTYAADKANWNTDVVWLSQDSQDAGVTIGTQETHPDVDLNGDILATGSYEVATSAGTGSFADTVDSSDDLATLFVSERGESSLDLWTASDSDASSIGDLEDLNAALEDGTLTETDTVTEDDYLALEVQADGLSGLIANNSTYDHDADDNVVTEAFVDHVTSDTRDWEGGKTNTTTNFSIALEQTDAASNRAPKELIINETTKDAMTVLYDQDSNTYYALLDVDQADYTRSLSDEDEFEASLNIKDSRLLGADLGDYSTANGYENEVWESTTQELEYLTPDGSFDLNEVDDTDYVTVENAEEQEVTGEINVAPGTEVTVRLRGSEGSSFVKSQNDVVVNSDGTFSATFDFSDRDVDDEFTASLRSGDELANEDGLVVEQAVDEPEDDETAPEDGNETDDGMDDGNVTDDGETDDGATDDGETTDDGATDDGESTDDESSDDTPGFGAIVALVAVLGAALLATRRQN